MDIPKYLAEINEKAYKIASNIKLLGPISWPIEAEEKFLGGWKKKSLFLPKITYSKISYQEQAKELNNLLKSLTGSHPMEQFTKKTIESYIEGTQMIEAIETKRFQEVSQQIFGCPKDKILGCNTTHLQAAKILIDSANRFEKTFSAGPEICVSAQMVKTLLDQKISEKFQTEGPQINLIKNLNAKSTGGAKFIHLRNKTCYSIYDADQLFNHEVMTHSLTSINGHHQPILKILGRGAPRTTTTQEGLATFSEIITSVIDLKRIKRIALRIFAINMALEGANFVEIFKYFLENGQSEEESFWSSARIFRGGQPDGNIIFTKDVVYLEGLIKVYSLFKWAMINEKLDLLGFIFCGRLTIEDIFLLKEYFKEDLIIKPKLVPTWYEKIEGLAGILSFSIMSELMPIQEIELYFNNLHID